MLMTVWVSPLVASGPLMSHSHVRSMCQRGGSVCVLVLRLHHNQTYVCPVQLSALSGWPLDVKSFEHSSRMDCIHFLVVAMVT